MVEDIKNLIEKIQQEGIKAAQEQAKDIEDQARRRAEALIEKAEKDAQKLIVEAKDRVAKMEKSGSTSLEQAGRDLLLTLREEINVMLDKLVVAQVRQALESRELINIITMLLKDVSGKEKAGTIVSLDKKDLKKLEQGFLGKLSELAKQGITLRSSADVRAGFTISYDSGRSHYDFTDRALAQYLGLHLKPKLAELLKKAVSGGKKAQRKG